MMNDQGLLGALWQYWNISDKPRLNRKNTYFEELKPSNKDALVFAMLFTIIAIAIFFIWSIGVVLL
jgi:hypothetical protein